MKNFDFIKFLTEKLDALLQFAAKCRLTMCISLYCSLFHLQIIKSRLIRHCYTWLKRDISIARYLARFNDIQSLGRTYTQNSVDLLKT